MIAKRYAATILILFLASTLGVAQKTGHKRAPHNPPATATAAAPAAPLRTKLAEGRYELRSQSGQALSKWEEPWTLYKTKTGFEVEEVWKASKEGVADPVVIDVLMAMAPGLYPTQVRIGSDLSPSQLVCSMVMNEFRCSTDGMESTLPMLGQYHFYLPSPWLLSSIARRAPLKPDMPVKIKLVQVGGMTPRGPKLEELPAEVAYVGEDQINVGPNRLAAGIYEIRGSAVPAIIVWVSPEGVVLMMQDAAKPDQRMELVEFKKFAAF